MLHMSALNLEPSSCSLVSHIDLPFYRLASLALSPSLFNWNFQWRRGASTMNLDGQAFS